MVPSKFIRHLKTKHAIHAHKNTNYFQRMLSQNKKQEYYMKLSFTVSEKALETSYHVAKLIARPKKTQTIGESLLKPTCQKIVQLMLGPKEVKKVRKVPLSADNIKRRFDDISIDMLEILIKKIKASQNFSFRLTKQQT